MAGRLPALRDGGQIARTTGWRADSPRYMALETRERVLRLRLRLRSGRQNGGGRRTRRADSSRYGIAGRLLALRTGELIARATGWRADCPRYVATGKGRRNRRLEAVDRGGIGTARFVGAVARFSGYGLFGATGIDTLCSMQHSQCYINIHAADIALQKLEALWKTRKGVLRTAKA